MHRKNERPVKATADDRVPNDGDAVGTVVADSVGANPLVSLIVPRLPPPNVAQFAAPLPTTSEELVAALHRLGVQYAFGVLGGAIAPLCQAIQRSPIELLHFRHESAAAFAATEASLASDRPVVVFSTTGPGITNALTGIFAARGEGAKVIVISGCTSALQRGRYAFQETSVYSIPAGLSSSGLLFHYGVQFEHAGELDYVVSRLSTGLARPDGFVAHLSLPIGVQTASREPIGKHNSSVAPPVGDATLVEDCVAMLAEGPFVIWVGYGARRASAEIRRLAERTGSPVMSSPRAKGIFPERHPLYLGNTGIGGDPTIEAYLRKMQPRHVLVLGTRLGEGTSSWSPDLMPTKAFIHVDTDAAVFGAAYPTVQTVGIQAEIKRFVGQLADSERLSIRELPSPIQRHLPARVSYLADGPVRPQALMQAIQEHFIDRDDASIVMAEAGNSALWANHHLSFAASARYRVSTSFGSMGQTVVGLLGASLGSAKKAVAIVGDGAMLMFNEVSTAVQYGIDAIWIVLNDAQYGMIEQGMRTLGWQPFATEIPRADFVGVARALGADGVHVRSEAELDAALRKAFEHRGPFVVDVEIDGTQMAPSLQRNKSLMLQAANNSESDSR